MIRKSQRRGKMDRVRARGSRIKKLNYLNYLKGCWELCRFSSSIEAFTQQHCRHLWPLCPPITGPSRGIGTDREGKWGSQKDHTQHCLLWDRHLEMSGFCSPRRGTLAPIRCVPHTGPNPAWPWLHVTVALQTAQHSSHTSDTVPRVNAEW